VKDTLAISFTCNSTHTPQYTRGHLLVAHLHALPCSRHFSLCTVSALCYLASAENEGGAVIAGRKKRIPITRFIIAMRFSAVDDRRDDIVAR
jgi:hypothetical protein